MKTILTLIFAATLAATASARNIDLSTVPNRDTVQLTIYNSEDLTLVRETRKVTFKQGVNPLQFSWANTLIDPTSVQLRFLNHADRLDVLDTTFPHDKPQMLYWNVGSEHAGEATIEISYFTSGITWSSDYTVITDADEKHALVEGFVTVSNHSGEDYEEAQVRLVVGTINLVEQIRQLAQNAGKDLDDLSSRERNDFRLGAARRSVAEAESMMDAAAPAAAKQIVKQGLSEYFIFSIEGTETIPTNSRKRMPSFKADNAPLTVQYRYRPREYGDQLVRLFLMTNDTESGMGTSPLPDGQVSVLRHKEDGRGLSFVARQHVKYIPIGEDIELNLGGDPNVGFEAITQRVYRDNIWLRIRGGNVYRRADEPTIPGGIKIEENSTVEGWNSHHVVTRRVRNDTPRPIEIEVRENIPGDATFISRLDARRFDNNTVTYTRTLDPGDRFDATYEVVTRQGHNAKQSRVEIVDGDPAVRQW